LKNTNRKFSYVLFEFSSQSYFGLDLPVGGVNLQLGADKLAQEHSRH